MLHPSYSDLMKVVNSEVEPGEAPVVNSRYSIVMATSKRARQIIAGDEPMVKAAGKKPLSVAIEELNQSKIRILSEEEAELQRKQMEEMRERFARAEEAMESYALEQAEGLGNAAVSAEEDVTAEQSMFEDESMPEEDMEEDGEEEENMEEMAAVPEEEE